MIKNKLFLKRLPCKRNRVYMKRENDVFARHLLATRKKQTVESLQRFLQSLKVLLKNCSFQAASFEQYREVLFRDRDAFINGLNSHAIRQ